MKKTNSHICVTHLLIVIYIFLFSADPPPVPNPIPAVKKVVKGAIREGEKGVKEVEKGVKKVICQAVDCPSGPPGPPGRTWEISSVYSLNVN